MFFLFIAVLESIFTIIIGIVALSSKFYIGFIAFLSLIISCIFWFSLYSMWRKTKKNKEEITLLKNSLNECRKKLNLPELEEKKTENEVDDLPTYNPFFNPYAEENGIDIDENQNQ